MEAQIRNNQYVEMQLKIKSTLARAVKQNKIKIEDLLAILFVFSFTITVDDLYFFIDVFSSSFPVLDALKDDRRAEIHGDYEKKIKDIVQKMATRNPLRAAEIAKFAMKPDMSLDILEKEFPEIIDNNL